ncbi:MAG: hypothetical protein ABI771_04630 [Betaproteobacteria bacterium]
MDDSVIRAMAKWLDARAGPVSGAPGLGSPAGAAWGGVESGASSRETGRWMFGTGIVTGIGAWTK